MPRDVSARLRAAERRLGEKAERRGYTLEQLVRAAMGEDPGAPAAVLKPGKPSLEELIADTQLSTSAEDDMRPKTPEPLVQGRAHGRGQSRYG